jgi:NAD(P)-dependent dehydrogenase (short-subunit alcohol dehydrogenase family)
VHFAADLTDPDAAGAAVARAVELYGGLDVVVNNAAGGVIHDGFLGESVEAWVSTLNLNLLGAVRVMHAALPHLVDRGGVIVNVASVNARYPASDGASYSAAKAALLNVGKNVATEYAAQGVRVITVSPGLTATPMWLGEEGIAQQFANTTGESAEAIAESAAQGTPLKRFLQPEEVAACIVFAASGRASALTGAEIVVDGGLTPTI